MGQTFVYTLKEALSRSALFTYTTDETKGFVLRINSAATNGDAVGAISIVLLGKADGYSYYIDQWALRVSTVNPGGLVPTVLAGLSEDMDIIQKK